MRTYLLSSTASATRDSAAICSLAQAWPERDRQSRPSSEALHKVVEAASVGADELRLDVGGLDTAVGDVVAGHASTLTRLVGNGTMQPTQLWSNQEDTGVKLGLYSGTRRFGGDSRHWPCHDDKKPAHHQEGECEEKEPSPTRLLPSRAPPASSPE